MYLEMAEEGYGGLEGAAEGKEEKLDGQKLLKAEEEENVDQWEKERSALLALADGKRREQDAVSRRIYEINTRDHPDGPGSHRGGTGAAGKRAGI